MYPHASNVRPAPRQEPPAAGSLCSTHPDLSGTLVPFDSFCRLTRWLLPGVCPSNQLMVRHDRKTDRGQFWSVFPFSQRRHSQRIPTNSPENRPKNSRGHGQFSVRHITSPLREASLVSRVRPLSVKNKNQVPLSAFRCPLVPFGTLRRFLNIPVFLPPNFYRTATLNPLPSTLKIFYACIAQACSLTSKSLW